jgi:lipopolysaccharide/colanic/teichoic acid biosynthesis glycosyltransferase
MYVRNYSLAMDVKILFQTIRVVLQREQANGVKMDKVRYRANVS